MLVALILYKSCGIVHKNYNTGTLSKTPQAVLPRNTCSIITYIPVADASSQLLCAQTYFICEYPQASVLQLKMRLYLILFMIEQLLLPFKVMAS